MRDVISLKSNRYVPDEAGVMRPEIVDILKEDILIELAADLADMAELFGFVTWHIDGNSRQIEGKLRIDLATDENEEEEE